MRPSTIFYLLNFLFLYTSTLAQTIHIPLETPPQPKSNLKKHVTRYNSKSGSVPINNLMDVNYYGQVKIGSQKTKFNLVLDTGSSNVWIPDVAVPEAKNALNCSESETCKMDISHVISLRYAVGLAAGYQITDQLDLGGLVLSDFPIILAFIVRSIELTNYDGILGLALGRYKPEIPTVLERLKEDGLISVGTFSMYLGNDPEAWGKQTGELIFGGYDPKYALSEFQFVNVRKETETMYWSTDLMGLGYGSEVNVSSITNAPVIFDSGTSLLTLPGDFIKGIIEHAKKEGVSCAFDRDEELYKCDCKAKEKMEELVFYFDNVTLSIPPTSYIYEEEGNCYLSMQVLEGQLKLDNPIVLGDVFLKNFYTMYNADNYTVGFAQALPIKKFNRSNVLYVVGGVVLVGALIGLGVYLHKKKKMMQQKKMHDHSSAFYEDWNESASASTSGVGRNTDSKKSILGL